MAWCRHDGLSLCTQDLSTTTKNDHLHRFSLALQKAKKKIISTLSENELINVSFLVAYLLDVSLHKAIILYTIEPEMSAFSPPKVTRLNGSLVHVTPLCFFWDHDDRASTFCHHRHCTNYSTCWYW